MTFSPDPDFRYPDDPDRARLNDPAVSDALEYAFQYGQIDGAHHLRWVIDRMVRSLTGSTYETWLIHFCHGDDGPETYYWDEGTPP